MCYYNNQILLISFKACHKRSCKSFQTSLGTKRVSNNQILQPAFNQSCNLLETKYMSHKEFWKQNSSKTFLNFTINNDIQQTNSIRGSDKFPNHEVLPLASKLYRKQNEMAFEFHLGSHEIQTRQKERIQHQDHSQN